MSHHVQVSAAKVLITQMALQLQQLGQWIMFLLPFKAANPLTPFPSRKLTEPGHTLSFNLCPEFQTGSITITLQISMHLSVSEREKGAQSISWPSDCRVQSDSTYIQHSKFEFQIVAGSGGMSVWCGQPQMALASATAVLIRGIWPVRLPAN